MTEWIERLVTARVNDHRSDPDSALAAPPGLRPPADASQISELEGWLRQPIESGYREFLEFSDGMDNFRSGMPLLGWQDWPSGDALSRALHFRDIITSIDVHIDEGLTEDAVLAPVSVNRDGTVGIFMVWDEESPEKRYFWVGNGDAAFFSTLSEVFDVASGVRSWSEFSTE
ncbi:hypothetical protein ABZW30_36145 [Kitasatospora sp. NPDC004669]|uniref:hypothetical protein n=1 Tax=Kitasatospora sp. NPDC004669 TaxID=3154555 RepID=UPI0033BE0725